MMQLMRAGRLAANEILQAAASWDALDVMLALPAERLHHLVVAGGWHECRACSGSLPKLPAFMPLEAAA